jgi:hypothetical protein
VLHSHHIAARRSRRVAGRVFGEFCLMHPKQESVLFP